LPVTLIIENRGFKTPYNRAVGQTITLGTFNGLAVCWCNARPAGLPACSIPWMTTVKENKNAW
jgi:hypothetical protein